MASAKIQCWLFILSLSCPEHLNVTTFLASSIISPPVAGFLPLLSRFALTQNLPKPLMRTSSPEARAGFDEFKEGFDKLDGLISRVSGLISECFSNVVLREGHWWESSVYWWSMGNVVG